VRRLAGVLLLALLASCSKKEETKASVSTGTTSTPPSEQGVPGWSEDAAEDPPVAPGQPAPEAEPGARPPGLSLSANDSTRPVLFKGWPLVIRLHADPGIDGSKSTPEVLDGAGAPVNWPLTASGGVWSLPGEETARLAAGSYRIRAAAGAVVEEIPLEVQEPPAALTPAQARERLAREVQALLQTGKVDAALELARKQRTGSPSDPNPSVLEGDALRAMGKKSEAAAAYRRALEQHRKANPKVREAPGFLLHRLAAVQEYGEGK
jgi:hypothetical protein